MGRFLATTDDVLGYATAGDIILTGTTYGVQNTFVEAAAETGKIKQSAIKTIKPYTDYTNSYTLRSSSLVLAFGIAIATDYFLLNASVTQTVADYVKVTVNFRKFTTAAMFDAANSFDVPTGSATPLGTTVVGGFGIVDLLGCTIAGCPQSINYTIGGELTGENVLHVTSGDFCTGAILLHKMKKTCQVTTTGATITLPASANATKPLDVQKDNSGELHITSADFYVLLDPAA